MGLYIFEGNENSGKTTLIDKLMQYRPWFIKCKRWTHKNWYDTHQLSKSDVNYNPYPANWDLKESFFYDWRFFLETIGYDEEGFTKASFVFDRSFITDLIFKRALYPADITDEYLEHYAAYEHEMQKIPHVIFYCKRAIGQQFNDHFAGSRHLTQHDYDALQVEYDYWLKTTKLNVVEIDNDNNSIEDNINIIIQHVGA